jgi:hypothetical protein
MKIKISLVLLLLFTAQISTAQFWNKTKIKGNNNYVTQKISTQSYDKINISSSIDVEIINGKEGNIVLKAEENLIEYIEIYCKNNTLTIKIKNNTNLDNDKQILVQIPVEKISEITSSGSSNVSGKVVLNSEKLNLNLSGSGDLSLHLDVENLNAKVVGSGSLTLKGIANTCDFNVAGSGALEGKKLICSNVVARVAGSGGCNFTVNTTLKAYVVGSGSINYTGEPEILESKTVGSGSIENRN